MRKLNCGSGDKAIPDTINVDISFEAKLDVQADIRNLPFRDSAFDEVFCLNTLEHFLDPVEVIEEIYRVCQRGADVFVEVPHFSGEASWGDPTHKRTFTSRSFDYFSDQHVYRYYSVAKFNVVKKKLIYLKNVSKVPVVIRPVAFALSAMLTFLANLSPLVCEYFWCYWFGGFNVIQFQLRARKD